MGRRSDHTREELRGLILRAAGRIAAQDGLEALTARRIAEEIGYSPGTLYNLFRDLDDIIVHLKAETLDELYAAITALPPAETPEDALASIAETYIRFTGDRQSRWKLVFQHSPSGAPLPDWYGEKIALLFAVVEAVLAPLFPPRRETEVRRAACVLWSGLHGMCSLAGEGLVLDAADLGAMSRSLIENYVAGLRAQAGAAVGAASRRRGAERTLA